MKKSLFIALFVTGALYSCSKSDNQKLYIPENQRSYFNFEFDGKTYNSPPQTDTTRILADLGLHRVPRNGIFTQSMELGIVVTNTRYQVSLRGNNFNLGTVRGRYSIREVEIKGFTHQEDYYQLSNDSSSYIMLTDYSYEHNELSEVKGTYFVSCINVVTRTPVTSTGSFDIFFTPR